MVEPDRVAYLERCPQPQLIVHPYFDLFVCLEVLPCEDVVSRMSIIRAVYSPTVDVAGAFGGVFRSSGSCNSCPSVINAGVTPVA